MALDLTDKSPNGNNLSNSSGVSDSANTPFVTSTDSASFGSASSQSLIAPNSASLAITSDITVECWHNPSTIPASNGTIGQVERWNAVAAYHLSFCNNGGTHRMVWEISPDNVAVDTYKQDVATLGTATWYHWAVSWQASTSKAIFYLNGTIQGTVTGVQTAINSGNSTLSIGADANNQNYWNGLIDEVRIWNTVRTSGQIAGNYNVRLAGTETSLAAYWPFETLSTNTNPASFKSLTGAGI